MLVQDPNNFQSYSQPTSILWLQIKPVFNCDSWQLDTRNGQDWKGVSIAINIGDEYRPMS